MLREKLIIKIDFEIEQIENNFKIYNNLFELIKIKTPDEIEIAALGSIVHSFYTGIEKILKLIAKEIDKEFPINEKWHKDLLIQMNKSNNLREKVISNELFDLLLKYLNFRHFFRNAYEYLLDWNELKSIVFPIYDVWNRFKNEIKKFIKL